MNLIFLKHRIQDQRRIQKDDVEIVPLQGAIKHIIVLQGHESQRSVINLA